MDEKITRKHYLYHVTSGDNLESIMREGLKCKNGFCIYLSENPYSWWTPDLEIIRVRITGLKGLKTFIPESDEILCFEDISPLRIYKYIPKKSAYKEYRKRFAPDMNFGHKEDHFRDTTKMMESKT